MTDITPASMLADYRANADEFMQSQARMFRGLSPVDQRELLFYMNMHTSMTMMQLQQAVMAMRPRPNFNG